MTIRQFARALRSRIWPAGRLVLLLLALTVPRAAAAEDSSKPQPDATTYDFEDTLVRGDTFGPDGRVLQARRRAERMSLIRVRKHFMPELFKTAEDL